MATITGKTVRYGMTALDDCLITSAEITITDEAKEYANETGSTVAIVTDVNPRAEATIEVTMLDSTSVSTLKSAVESWLTTEAVALGLDSGGTSVTTSVAVSESNTDAATASVSATYFPAVTTTTA